MGLAVSAQPSDDLLVGLAWMRGDPERPPLADWLRERADELAAFRQALEPRGHRARAAAALRRAAAVPLHGAPHVVSGGVLSLDRLPGASTRTISWRARQDRLCHTVHAEPEAAIDWFHPAPSGRLLVVGTSSSGSERSVGAIVDLSRGRRLSERLEGVRSASVAWFPDESGFFYTRYPGDRDYGREIWRHRLGTSQSEDERVWGQDADATAWPDVELSPDGTHALVHVSIGWTRTDVHLLDLHSGRTITLVEGRDSLTRFHFSPRGTIAGVTGVDAPYGRVVRVDLAAPASEDWIEVLAESDVVLDDCAVGDRTVFVVGEKDMSGVVGVVTLEPDGSAHDVEWAPLPIGQIASAVPTPGQSTMRTRVVRHLDADTAVFTWSTLDAPPRLLTWTPGSPPCDWAGDPLAVASAVRATEVVAGDGETLPLLLLDPQPEGPPLPTLLHGYGGFGLSSTAAYSEVAAAWLALGGRYVVAGLRGGRERGADWHEQGRLDRRQRVFDDFADVADALVADGVCDRDRLGIWGSSNGGLLIAATLVQRPDLCAAAHAAVPMTDMLGYHRLSIARLWMSDFGDPENPDHRDWIRAYSPLHGLGPAPAVFPDVIVTTGRHDTRVDPFHSYAFVKALRARRSAEAPELLLLGEDLQGGHGVGKPADRLIEERADVFALMFTAFARRAAERDALAPTDSDSL